MLPQGVVAFLADPTAQLVRDWVASTGMIGGVVYVIRASAEMRQWTKDHTKENDQRFEGHDRRLDGLGNAVGQLGEKITDTSTAVMVAITGMPDKVRDVAQELLSSFDERLLNERARLDSHLGGGK